MLQLFWPLILSKSRLRVGGVVVHAVVGWFTAVLLVPVTMSYVAPHDRMPGLRCTPRFRVSGSAAKTALRASDATRIFQIGGHGAEIELSKGAHHHCPSPLGHRFSRFDPELLNPGSYRGEPHIPYLETRHGRVAIQETRRPGLSLSWRICLPITAPSPIQMAMLHGHR